MEYTILLEYSVVCSSQSVCTGQAEGRGTEDTPYHPRDQGLVGIDLIGWSHDWFTCVALMSVGELAKGVVYTESIETGLVMKGRVG